MNTPTILCVDDERNVLLTLRTQLMRHFPDYAIEIAESGDEALALVDQLRAEGIEVPLVIADQIMPGMHGDQLLIELHARYPEILKVMLTGQARAEDVGNVVNRGSLYRFIAKPWDETDLNLTVSEALRCYRQEQQLAQQQAALEQANRELLALNAELEQQVQERTQELRQREQQLRLFVQHTPLAVAMFDRQMRYLVASERWIKDYNLDAQAILGKCHYELFPNLPDDWREIHQRGLNGFVERSERDLYIRPDGRQEWVRWEVRPWYDLNHTIGGIIVFGEIITDRIQIELALQDSEERYRLLSEVNPVGIFRNDLQGRCIYANAKTLEITGLSLEENLGEGWGRHLHPDDHDRMYAAWSNFVQQTNLGHEAEYKVEQCYRYPDGSMKWAFAQAVPEYNSAGELVGFIGSVVDITDRKLTEIALLEAQRIAHIGSWEFDLQTQVITWSEELYHMFGLDPSRPVPPYEEYLQKIHPDDRPKLLQCVEQAIASGTPYLIDYRIILPDGSIRYQEGRGEVIRNAQGRVVKLRGTALDISDRKQAEAALQEKQQQLTSLLNNIPHIAWLKDRESRFLAVNEPFAQACGYSPSQLVGLTDLDIWPAHLAAAYRQDDHEVMASRQPKRVEEPLRTATGVEQWIETIKTPILNELGEAIGTAGIAMDITDRKQAELALQQLNEELEQRVQQRTQELAQSEQDLRTIFNHVYDAIFIHDLDGTILDVNDRALELHGATREQLIGGSISDLSAPDASFDLVPEILQRVQAGENLRFEWQGRRFDNGSIFDAEVFLQQVTLGNRPVLIAGARDISDRKQAESQLAESEAKFRRLVESANDLVYMIGLDGCFTYLSPQFREMWGYEIADCLGKPFTRIVHPEDLPKVNDVAQWVLQNQQRSSGLEFRTQRQDGSWFWIVCNSAPIVDAKGDVVGLQGIARDLSDRKQAEEAIRSSQEQMQLALEGSGDGLWDWHISTGYVYLSPRWLGILEYEVGDLAEHIDSWELLIHPEDKASVMEVLNAHLQDSSVPYQVEYRARTKTGKWKWIANYGKVVSRDAQGIPLRMVGLQRDISDRKQAEIDLRESQKFLQTVIDTFPLVVFWKDRQSVYLGCNSKSAIVAGLSSPTEIIGKTDYDMPWAAAEAELYRADDREVMESGHAKLGIIETQLRADGSKVWIETNKLPLRNLNGEVIGVLGTYQDITDRKQAEADLRNSEERFRAAFEQAAVGMVQVDLEGRFTQMNQKFCDIVGYSESELLLKSFGEITHPDDLAADEANVRRLLAGEASTFVMEKRYFRKNGTIVWVNLSVSLVKNSAGEPQYFIAVIEDISSRKQAEQQLRAERLRLKLALEAADMGTWESNLETGIWSARTEEIFGYAPGTFPGDREAFLRLVHIDDQERVFAALFHSFATRSPYKVEYRINHLNGELRWVAVNGKVVESEDGSGLRIVGVALDITERKQAEAALRDSEERLRLALAAANQGLYDLNVQTGKAIVSPEYAAMLGYDPATFEETNAKWIERLHPDDIEPIAATYRAYVAGEIPDYRVEFRQRAQEGDWKWILSLGKIVAWDEAGQPLRMLGTHTDIDDRKRVEEELRQAISINQALLNAIPDLILRMSRDGIYRDCIPSYNVILLTPHDELVGKSIWEILPADLAQQRLDAIERAFQTGLPQIHEYQIYIDGELRYEEARCVVCRDDEAMVLVRDITDRKRAEIALQQLNQELEQRIHDRTLELQKAMEAAKSANLAKSTFLANMSHELRTPLNAILGFAQLLSRDVTMAAEQRHQLAIINNSGKHLLNLINDILEMSKIEAGRIQFEASSFDLSLLLDLLEEMFQMRAREKGLHLIVERAAGLPRYVRTDEHKLRQVLINLLGNAIKFTLAGQVELHIRPSAGGLASELGLEFQVCDTGIGIASDELESLFEPFTQSRSRQVFQEGTGLGLSISRQFVQLLGGDLRVTSTQGVGSSFSFSIPVQPVEGAECPSTASGPTILGLAANQPSYRILVAEDIETNRLLMVQLLQSLGFAVQSAGTGEEAIAVWEHWQPQLIWMDMRMPGMDGYEATRQIRARERQRGGEFVPTIIIALTASAFEEDRARVLAAGCDDFVRKPFQEAELLEKMAVYLGVEYVYAAVAAAENPVVASELDVNAALQSLPLPLLQQLYQATLELDSKQLTGLLQGLAAEHPQLATLLLEKLENFDLEEILHLLQQAMKL
ncbi:PAS domain S-box protein [Leptodesmis sichuanensis]|uniref:PAS domain S-box protein n=1 Tax=Leptodesmis sichuanensis TaxID=2906798 RepID=UPI001F317803|nr:PAS domain S-box protein [Leptodesmis sichuanensis]UIE38007.1 PAS domain S-box protein [Leptodesmis sichuanensis A121]